MSECADVQILNATFNRPVAHCSIDNRTLKCATQEKINSSNVDWPNKKKIK